MIWTTGISTDRGGPVGLSADTDPHPFCLGDLPDCDRLSTVWAWAADPDSAAGSVAVDAPLFGDVAGLAFGALVDRVDPSGFSGFWGDLGGALAGSVGPLPAGVRAVVPGAPC